MEKICKTCLIIKSTECYGKHKSMADGLRKSCKECRKLEKTEYRTTNGDKISECGKLYYLNNKDTIVQKRRIYEKNKYNNDNDFYLHSCMSARIRIGLKTKSKNTKEYIGCSFEFLSKYIQSLFEDGMSWDNKGTVWEIDHIIPVSAWDLTNDFENKCCWNYRNLRPLWKYDNRKKSNKYNPDDKSSFMIKMRNETQQSIQS